MEKAESDNQITFVSSTATEFQKTSQCSLLESLSVCKPTMVVTMTQFCSDSQTLRTLYNDISSYQSSHCQLPSSTGVMLHKTLVLPKTYLSQSLSGITSVSGIHVIYSSSTNYKLVLHFSDCRFYETSDHSKTIGYSSYTLCKRETAISQAQHSNTQAKIYDPGIGDTIDCHTNGTC